MYNDPRLPARFWSKVLNHPATGCWEWIAAKNAQGYGVISHKAERLAHRLCFSVLVGPPGPCIDHLCRNPACVNPGHLEAVTQRENMRRAEHATGTANSMGRKTRCPAGHPYDETNTRKINGRRVCKTCTVARTRAWRLKNGGSYFNGADLSD